MGRGIDSRNRVWNWVAKLHRLAGRYDIPMPTWFLALIAGHKFRHSVADGSPYPDRVGSTSFCRIRIDKHYFFPKNFKLLSKILRIMTHWTLIRNVKLCKQALLWLKVFFSYTFTVHNWTSFRDQYIQYSSMNYRISYKDFAGHCYKQLTDIAMQKMLEHLLYSMKGQVKLYKDRPKSLIT